MKLYIKCTGAAQKILNIVKGISIYNRILSLSSLELRTRFQQLSSLYCEDTYKFVIVISDLIQVKVCSSRQSLQYVLECTFLFLYIRLSKWLLVLCLPFRLFKSWPCSSSHLISGGPSFLHTPITTYYSVLMRLFNLACGCIILLLELRQSSNPNVISQVLIEKYLYRIPSTGKIKFATTGGWWILMRHLSVMSWTWMLTMGDLPLLWVHGLSGWWMWFQ